MTSTGKKLNTLQVLRCIAFLGIMLDHTGYTIFANMRTGAWGVSVFLVLSGFTMIYSYYGKDRIAKVSVRDNIKFAYQKVRRLYPLHVVATLIMFVGSYVNGTNIFPPKMAITRLLLNLLLVQEYLPIQNRAILIVSWYLCTAVLSYFLFPWILRWMERSWSVRKAVRMMVVTAVLIGG